MASSDDVRKLAQLARVNVPEADLERFAKEFDGILSYVGQLDALSIDMSGEKMVPKVHNVMREDGTPHEKGMWTEKLASQFPDREGDSLSVKQIISHD